MIILVKPHSKVKHLILGYYYSVLDKAIFRNPKFFSWYYVDLFCGDGRPKDESIPQRVVDMYPEEALREWDAPFFRLFEYADAAQQRRKFTYECYFNDSDKKVISSLEDKFTSEMKKYVKGTYNQDANVVYDKILKLLRNENRPGVFYLDPFNHEQLAFDTIKGIASFVDKKTGRRPNLIINLMTYSMLQGISRGGKPNLKKSEYASITKSLGTDEWIGKLEEYGARHKTHELFLHTFLNQLKTLGYETISFSIESIEKNSTQYYLIFATSNKGAQNIHLQVERGVNKLKTKEWVKKIARITKASKSLSEPTQKRLFDD